MDLLQWERLNARLDQTDLLIARLREIIMAAFDDLQTKLTSMEGKQDMVVALLGTIHQELVDILATGVTPEKVQALADRIDADTQKLADAAAANPDPTPPPAA
jgi:hypothetical protein